MQLFYEGLGAVKQSSDLVLVNGIHSMNLSNRELVYEWFNKCRCPKIIKINRTDDEKTE
jgi:hypothetical protein